MLAGTCGFPTFHVMHCTLILQECMSFPNFLPDNLILEFNLVLLDNEDLVSRDEEHEFQTTVMYTNGPDLEQTEDIVVIEPDITMNIRVANRSQIGDPGE